MAAGTAIVFSGANHWGVVTMGKRGFRALCALLVSLVFAVAGVGPGVAQAPPPPGDGHTPTLSPGAQIPEPDDETEARLLLLDQQFISTRTAGDGALSVAIDFAIGILTPADGGNRWAHGPGAFFAGVSTARLAGDPNNPNPRYAAIRRGRGGARRVSPPIHSTYGIWESHDGAVTWNLLIAAPSVSLGATDIRLDPQSPTTLYASFWSDKIYKSTNGGATWNPIMNGLPTDANFAAGLTRFNLALSHPAGHEAVLYTGFDWVDTAKHHQAGRLFKSTDGGAISVETGHGTGIDSVLGYCGTQCLYDNVIETNPTNPDVVFAAGSFGYNLHPPSGRIFRSMDGGQTRKNLGSNQHADFHALAFDPNNTAHILIGSDGAV